MTALTFEQGGAALNVLGLLVPVLFSLSIARTHSRPFFAYWVWSYAFYLLAILGFLGGVALGESALLDLFKAGCLTIGSCFLIKTTITLREDRPLPLAGWLVCAGTLAIAVLLVVLGQPFTVTAIPPALLVTAAHFWFAHRLLKLPRAGQPAAARLAWLMVAMSLWTLGYPLFGHSHMAWLGYAVSGLFHLLIGIEMVIYLLEDTSRLLAEQNAALRQLDRLKSNFISTVSHELRTPLTAIKGAAFLVGSPRVSPEEIKGIITQQTDALTHIVTDMLDASMIEAGAMAYHKGPVCLGALAAQAVAGMRPLFEQKGLTLAVDVPHQPVEVLADPARLNQVLTNLLSNALKFTPDGRVTVRVIDEGARARLEVEDSGVGMAPEEHAKVFERFYQVDNSSTRKVGGAGLGLAIAKAIVEEGHRGRLWVESQLGRGSTFVVSLPRA